MKVYRERVWLYNPSTSSSFLCRASPKLAATSLFSCAHTNRGGHQTNIIMTGIKQTTLAKSCPQNMTASCKFSCVFFLPCPSLAGWLGTDRGHALHWSAIQQMNLPKRKKSGLKKGPGLTTDMKLFTIRKARSVWTISRQQRVFGIRGGIMQ